MRRKVLARSEVAKNVHKLTFEWDNCGAIPGQFFMIRVSDSLIPLLRRPMSVADADESTASIIFKVVGTGTRILSGIDPGAYMDVDGPYGNSFTPPDGARTVLVGGGVGIPPLLYYAKKNAGSKMLAIIGGASENDIFGVGELAGYGAEVVVTTEDGSAGIKGLVTGPMESMLKGEDRLIACGPKGMLAAVEKICAAKSCDGELSVEEKMACGFGVCLGCMVETVMGRKRVCHEGPVFKTGVLTWK